MVSLCASSYTALAQHASANFDDIRRLLLLMQYGIGDTIVVSCDGVRKERANVESVHCTERFIVVRREEDDSELKVAAAHAWPLSPRKIPLTPPSPFEDFPRGYQYLPPLPKATNDDTDEATNDIDTNVEASLDIPSGKKRSSVNEVDHASPKRIKCADTMPDNDSCTMPDNDSCTMPDSDCAIPDNDSCTIPDNDWHTLTDDHPYAAYCMHLSSPGSPLRSDWDLLLIAHFGEGARVEVQLVTGAWKCMTLSWACVRSRCVVVRDGDLELVVNANRIRQCKSFDAEPPSSPNIAGRILPPLVRKYAVGSAAEYVLAGPIIRSRNGLALQRGMVRFIHEENISRSPHLVSQVPALFLVE